MRKVLRVRISEHGVARGSERLKSYGLGSCICLVVFDPRKKIGAMAHVLLPKPANSHGKAKSAKYAASAVAVLVDELCGAGCDSRHLVAKIAGGANMFPRRFNLSCDAFGMSIGERNIRAVKQALARKRIRLVAEEVGGETGRTIEFNPRNGELIVYKSNGEVKVI